MNKKVKASIINELDKYNEYESFIDDVVVLFDTLIILNKRAETPHILGAIAFFVAPLSDIMDFAIYGPYGFIPYIWVAATALQKDHDSSSKHLAFLKEKCEEILNEEEIKNIVDYLGW